MHRGISHTRPEDSVDAFALLKADHKRIGNLIVRLEVTTERSDKYRAGVFEQLRKNVVAHLEVEEEILYPALKDYKQIQPPSPEAQEEGKGLRILLEEIASIPVYSKEWEAKFVAFRESLRLHLNEKERDLFPKVRRALSPEEWEDLAVLLERAHLRHSFQSSDLVAMH